MGASRRLVALAAVLPLAIFVAHAAADPQRDAEVIAHQRDEILGAMSGVGLEGLLPGAQQLPGTAQSTGAGVPVPRRLTQRYAVLVSFSQPETVRAALELASADRSVVVVFRGLPDGQSLGEFFRRLSALTAKLATRPAMAIDPTVFRRFRVTLAPAVVDLDSGTVLRGVISPKALDSWRQDGLQDLGTVGPVVDILEPDLAEVLRARAATLDPAALVAQAQRRYWDHLTFTELPAAQIEATRLFDPTIYAQRDIMDHEGHVLVRAGERANPIAAVGFGLTVIAFDALDPHQVAIARAAAAAAARPVLITTRLDRSLGWEGLKSLEALLDAPLFLLDARAAERLGLRVVPSVVTAVGDRLQVHEIVPASADGEGSAP